MTMYPISLAKQLVSTLNPVEAARFSFENYHAVGLDYLCLLRTDVLTVKAYFFREDRKCQPGGDVDWIVWPHNHRYAFEHMTVFGTIRNHRFAIVEGRTHDLYAYDAEKRRPVSIATCGLKEIVRETTKAGESFSMPLTDEIHTLSFGSRQAVAIQLQYADTREQTAMVVPRGEIVRCALNTALYQKPTVEQVSSWTAELKEVLR